MLKGAPEGWRQTLDKLEAEIARIQGSGSGRWFTMSSTLSAPKMRQRSSLQGAIQRSCKAPLALWTRRVAPDRTHDGFPGRRSRAGQGQFRRRRDDDFDAIYHDVVPRERLVTPTRCVSTTGRFPFPSRRSRSSPQARDAPSSRFASRARFSTATTTWASANAERENSWTS
jgi:hypothetical protein